MTREEEDLLTVKKEYTFLVQRVSYKNVGVEVGEWAAKHMGDRMLIISRKRLGPPLNFGPHVITYGFKNEDDAIAFTLKFGKA